MCSLLYANYFSVMLFLNIRDSVVGYWAKKGLAFTANTTNPTGIYSVTHFTLAIYIFHFISQSAEIGGIWERC